LEGVHVSLKQFPVVFTGERGPIFGEGLKEAHRAKGVRFGPENALAVHDGNLDATPSQIHQEPAGGGEVHPVVDGEPDELRLLAPGNRLQVDPRFSADPIDELSAIAALANCTCRDRAVVGDSEVVDSTADSG
jgi:hypothetical protein